MLGYLGKVSFHYHVDGVVSTASITKQGTPVTAFPALVTAVFCLFPLLATAQAPVTIHVNRVEKLAAYKPVWGYFGYDEPNYTYAEHGRKLIAELASLSRAPVHIRTHFLLASGDGTPSLKWGSTNVYTEDGSGNPVYDWTIVDRILGTYVAAGAIPFVEIGFMPRALSTHPDPYQPVWKPHGEAEEYNLGWTYPPKSYEKWAELIYQWVRHSVAKFGRDEVAKWGWEVWNEPDIGYWHGTPEEYDRLYDYTTDAVKRALPGAAVGGPASTGPGNVRAAAFLKQFLVHCASGKNAVTGRLGAPLDFISYHAKGHPEVVDGHLRMGLSHELKDASEGFRIVKSFAQFARLPIVLSEADPEGCAACSARVYPQNAYRNGTLYASYEAAAFKSILELAAASRTNLQGILTWAFEFENQPYFEGFRSLATNGIDKPVLNFFRMAGLMQGDRVKAESSGATATDVIVNSGVHEKPDVDALAVSADHRATILIWNYRDDDENSSSAPIRLEISGIPLSEKRVLLRHYRIDDTHSNSYARWKQMSSPQNPSEDQYGELERAGQLQELESPRWIENGSGSIEIDFSLPLQALSLIDLEW